MSLRNPFPRDGGEYPLEKEDSKDESIFYSANGDHSPFEDPHGSEGKWPENQPRKRQQFDLPDPSEEEGMGDILYGILANPDSDPVEEIDEFRR